MPITYEASLHNMVQAEDMLEIQRVAVLEISEEHCVSEDIMAMSFLRDVEIR